MIILSWVVSSDAPLMGNVKSVYIIYKEDAVVLDCEAVSNPPLNFSWSKNRQMLTSGGQIGIKKSKGVDIYPYKTRLTFQNAQLNDSGSYKCEATNIIGQNTSSILLVVKGKN